MLAKQVEFKEEITSRSDFFLELFLSAQKQLKTQNISLRFRGFFGVKKWSEFFLELYLLSPLRLRLKNAPKETCGPTNVVQGSQKWCQNLAKIWPWVDFFWFSVHRVFERPYSVFAIFHWFALLQFARKTHQKQAWKITCFLQQHFMQKNWKIMEDDVQNGPPRPLLWALSLNLCLPFCEVRKKIDFGRLLGNFLQGPAAGVEAAWSFRFCRFWQKIQHAMLPLKGVRRIS